jgi:hypothetical protein
MKIRFTVVKSHKWAKIFVQPIHPVNKNSRKKGSEDPKRGVRIFEKGDKKIKWPKKGKKKEKKAQNEKQRSTKQYT